MTETDKCKDNNVPRLLNECNLGLTFFLPEYHAKFINVGGGSTCDCNYCYLMKTQLIPRGE